MDNRLYGQGATGDRPCDATLKVDTEWQKKTSLIVEYERWIYPEGVHFNYGKTSKPIGERVSD